MNALFFPLFMATLFGAFACLAGKLLPVLWPGKCHRKARSLLKVVFLVAGAYLAAYAVLQVLVTAGLLRL